MGSNGASSQTDNKTTNQMLRLTTHLYPKVTYPTKTMLGFTPEKLHPPHPKADLLISRWPPPPTCPPWTPVNHRSSDRPTVIKRLQQTLRVPVCECVWREVFHKPIWGTLGCAFICWTVSPYLVRIKAAIYPDSLKRRSAKTLSKSLKTQLLPCCY